VSGARAGLDIGIGDFLRLSRKAISWIYRDHRYDTMPRLYSPEQAAELLVGRRKALGLSQAEVAARLGISQNRLSELETRPERLTFDRLLALAGVLGLELTLGDRKPAGVEPEW
jgi:HTH-type transcriptional regulator/antitoxin HipB